MKVIIDFGRNIAGTWLKNFAKKRGETVEDAAQWIIDHHLRFCEDGEIVSKDYKDIEFQTNIAIKFLIEFRNSLHYQKRLRNGKSQVSGRVLRLIKE